MLKKLRSFFLACVLIVCRVYQYPAELWTSPTDKTLQNGYIIIPRRSSSELLAMNTNEVREATEND